MHYKSPRELRMQALALEKPNTAKRASMQSFRYIPFLQRSHSPEQ